MIIAEKFPRRNVPHFQKFNAREDQPEDFDSDVENDLNKEGSQEEQENNTRRQSARVKRQPSRYGDLIPSRLIPYKRGINVNPCK